MHSPTAHANPRGTGGVPTRSLRIVVADDDRDTVDMLSIILRDEGHVVHGVYSGKDVLPAVRAINPDAVILDISVPGLSGYAVAQEIRYSFTEERRPMLIAISGKWTEHADRKVAHLVGFDAHLLKPADPAELLALLRPLAART
ncbi:MAG TPA: response regulator [Burkholderiales bacterium]